MVSQIAVWLLKKLLWILFLLLKYLAILIFILLKIIFRLVIWLLRRLWERLRQRSSEQDLQTQWGQSGQEQQWANTYQQSGWPYWSQGGQETHGKRRGDD